MKLHYYINFAIFLSSYLFSFSAHSWNLFGPNNFNDCIIENMKGVTSDSAAASIRMACRQKFPEKKDTPPKFDLSRAGTPRVDVWDKDYPAISFSNITHGRFQTTPYGNHFLPITNKNNYDLSGVYLGIIAKKNQKFCSRDKSDYSEIIECNGDVSANTTKNVSCGRVEGHWCLVGFKGAYHDNVDTFFKALK